MTPQLLGEHRFLARLLNQFQSMQTLCTNEHEALALANLRSQLRGRFDELDAQKRASEMELQEASTAA